MVLDTMTLEELIREIKTDFSEVKRTMEELRTEIQENSSKKDNVPVVVGSEYQDTKIQRMVHFFLCRVEKRGWYFESHIHNVIQV